MLALLLVFGFQVGDTLRIRTIPRPLTSSAVTVDSAFLGAPQVRIETGQGTALVWLLRALDTVFVLASIPDSTVYWGDDFVVNLDTWGDGGPVPGHDDFQLVFRRVLDSSVVYRGRNGRWQPPRDDPDWRLGAERTGGGWEVSSGDELKRWLVLLRLDPAWFRGDSGRAARIAFRTYDDAPGGWHSWPPPRPGSPGWSVERTPGSWIPVK
jgi:hypothetical protein